VLVDALANVTAPIVVDPVFYATDGGDLGATAAGLIALLQRATIVTPNRSEAVVLAGEHDDEDALVSTVAEGLGAAAVLLKGGHARSPAVVTDRLWCEGRISRFTRPRLPGPDPRGTGCALATALACALAEGKGLVDAATEAIGWLDRVRTHTTDRGRDGHHLPATEPQ
jgi:hydroxymethylpyrimidine/phosphomethylpyrimidine kinase